MVMYEDPGDTYSSFIFVLEDSMVEHGGLGKKAVEVGRSEVAIELNCLPSF